MNVTSWLINDRFLLDTARHELYDRTTDCRHGLEPRLMKLLQLLLEQAGSVVSRETAIERIWANYSGANESLNQAISTLRKLLDDDRKQLIQTIPKTGYLFDGIVTFAQPITGEEPTKPVGSKRVISLSYRWALFMGVGLVSFLAGVFYYSHSMDVVKPPSADHSADSARLDSLQHRYRLVRERVRLERKLQSLDSLRRLLPLSMPVTTR